MPALDPASLSPPERYKLLIGLVVPRPIAFVSTVSAGGVHNLAPYSFFNAVGSDPMTLLFCPANKPDGSDKDSLRNASPEDEGGTGGFVVNVAAEAYAASVAVAAEILPHETSEFEPAGLTPIPSDVVAAPRVEESPAAFECRTDRIIRLNPGGPDGGNIVIGRVVRVHVRDGLIDERLRTDQEALAAFGRMGGPDYCLTRERFRMPRGLDAQGYVPEWAAESD